jgi:hypothetical protein
MLLCLAVLAAESRAQGVTITAPTTTRAPGVTFDAIYRISDVAGRNIISYEMDLHFNASVVQFNSCSVAGTISSIGTILCNNSSPGTIELVWNSVTPLSNDGDGPPSALFKVNFTVIGSLTQVSPLTFSAVQVMEFAVPATVVAGSVTVGGTTAADVVVAGRVLDPAGRGLSKARVRLIGSDGVPRYALTNGFGHYRFLNVAAGGTYLLAVESKRFTYAPRTISPGEDLFELDLIPEQ